MPEDTQEVTQPPEGAALGDTPEPVETNDDQAFDDALRSKMSQPAEETPADDPAPAEETPETPEAPETPTGPVDLSPKDFEGRVMRVKANGEMHEVKSFEQLQTLVSKGLAFDKSSNRLATARKAYEAFDAEIEKDQALKQSVGLLFHQPSLRQKFLELVGQLQDSGEVNPHEIEARVLRRELEQREVAEKEAHEEHARTQAMEAGRSLKEQHLTEIAKDLGKPVDEGYYTTLAKLVLEDRRAGTLLDAHKLYMLESGEYAKREAEKARQSIRTRQERIRQVQTPTGTGVAAQAADDDAEVDAFFASKLRI
jgi:ribosomal protein L18